MVKLPVGSWQGSEYCVSMSKFMMSVVYTYILLLWLYSVYTAAPCWPGCGVECGLLRHGRWHHDSGHTWQLASWQRAHSFCHLALSSRGLSAGLSVRLHAAPFLQNSFWRMLWHWRWIAAKLPVAVSVSWLPASFPVSCDSFVEWHFHYSWLL